MQLLEPKNLLGIGLYTPTEAAMYARMSPATLSRWLFGASSGDAVVPSELEGERIVTFLDFVQAMAVRSIRNTRKMPLQKIREAVRLAQDEFQVQFPLAKKHTVYLLGDEIIINVGNVESKRLVQASGKRRRNLVMTQVAELYMKDVGFDPTGLAALYTAFEYQNCVIRMDPRLRFGEPLLPSCGYSAQTLWEASISEGSITNAAKVYQVKEDEVETACRYIDLISPKTAA